MTTPHDEEKLCQVVWIRWLPCAAPHGTRTRQRQEREG